jgi:hypothetical protein
MKKSYQIKVIPGAGEAQTLDITASFFGGAASVKAVQGARYQLIDKATGQAPDNLRASRKGKDLLIRFDGREQADLVIADFYSVTAADTQALMGESQNGQSYPYIPESGEWDSSVSQMKDGATPVGMALGSEPVALADFSPAGLGVVAAAAGINPLWAAPLLLLGAAGGGGGGGAAVETTPPSTPTAAPTSYADNVGPVTSAASTASVTDDATPGVMVGKNLTEAPSLFVDGVKVAATYDPVSGTLTPTTPLTDGAHALTYTLTNAAGNESGQSPARNVTVDTRPPASPTSLLDGRDDNGVSTTDGITGINTPRISGVTEPNATVKVTINGHDYTGQADAQGLYVIQVTDPLPDSLPNAPQTYTVQVTDGAGNSSAPVNGTPFTVDTRAPAAPTGELDDRDDTGFSATDNLTGDNTPRITGRTEPNATVKITINGHDYTGQADAQGLYVIQVIDALPNTRQTYTVQATDAAGNVTTADGTPFTVDASSVSTSQGVELRIDAITQDTGVDAHDFITGDNTLTWSGRLIEGASVFNPEDGVQVQLLNAQSQVLATQYVRPQQTAGVWNWTWSGEALSLPDGVYTLKAQIVDTAGNVLSAPWAWSQNATVDTQPQQGPGTQIDPNADFSVHISRLLPDRGLSATDFLTSASQLTFTGNITSTPNHASFNATTGRVLNEVIDHNGKVVAFQYQTPSSTGNWSFDNTAVSLGVAGAVTTYTLKSVIVDNAGHFMNATSQAFTVDLDVPVVSNPGTVIVAGSNDYSQMSFSADEQGIYIFNGVQQTGGTLDLGGLTRFEAGQFNMAFRDAAGNEWTRSNTQAWDFHLLQPITLAMSSSSSPAFDNAQLVGSVGKLMMTAGQSLDLSSLYTLTPALQSNGGINHVVMGTGAQTLTVSIGDVLQLGISNSFANSAALRDHLQMRVDGDSADNLSLTKEWANSTAQSWSTTQGQVTLDGQTYNVYNNETLKLDLFVQSTVHVTVVL